MKTFNLNNFIHSILKDGGATFHLPTGRMTFKEGYFVGSADGEMITNLGNQRYKEEVIEHKIIDAVKEFISEKGFELMDADNYLGGWIDEGKLYLDITNLFTDKKEALSNGYKNKQIAIFDNKRGLSIYL